MIDNVEDVPSVGKYHLGRLKETRRVFGPILAVFAAMSSLGGYYASLGYKNLEIKPNTIETLDNTYLISQNPSFLDQNLIQQTVHHEQQQQLHERRKISNIFPKDTPDDVKQYINLLSKQTGLEIKLGEGNDVQSHILDKEKLNNIQEIAFTAKLINDLTGRSLIKYLIIDLGSPWGAKYAGLANPSTHSITLNLASYIPSLLIHEMTHLPHELNLDTGYMNPQSQGYASDSLFKILYFFPEFSHPEDFYNQLIEIFPTAQDIDSYAFTSGVYGENPEILPVIMESAIKILGDKSALNDANYTKYLARALALFRFAYGKDSALGNPRLYLAIRDFSTNIRKNPAIHTDYPKLLAEAREKLEEKNSDFNLLDESIQRNLSRIEKIKKKIKERVLLVRPEDTLYIRHPQQYSEYINTLAALILVVVLAAGGVGTANIMWISLAIDDCVRSLAGLNSSNKSKVRKRLWETMLNPSPITEGKIWALNSFIADLLDEQLK